MADRSAISDAVRKSVAAHLGGAVQVYNAAEALPNLINPFWMLRSWASSV